MTPKCKSLPPDAGDLVGLLFIFVDRVFERKVIHISYCGITHYIYMILWSMACLATGLCSVAQLILWSMACLATGL